VFFTVDSDLTNLIHDRRSCTLFTFSSVLAWLDVSSVHSSVNKPDTNGRVSYDSLTHTRLYCRDREKK